MQRIFFDIETLQYNTRASKPSERKVIEYVCTMIMKWKDEEKRIDFKNIHEMIEYLLTLGPKRYTLIAHNGSRYDFHFLRKTVKDYYGLKTLNKYQRNTEVHSLQTTKKELGKKEDYLLESRVKAKTNLDLDFRIQGVEFITEDSLPKFQASIATMGKLLYHHGIIGKEGEKLDYNYTRYDKEEDMGDVEARNYANKVYKQLSEHEKRYVGNDTEILYLAYEHYNDIFPGFELDKRSLSLNILESYNKSKLANIQLMNAGKIEGEKVKINYSNYSFEGRNLYDYIHSFYKGGLNVYNDRYVGKIKKDLMHFDLNSSYPNVMANEELPTYLVGTEKKGEVKLDKRYYYMLEIERNEFDKLLGKIPSVEIRKFLNKYFNNPTTCVYLSSPHIELLEKLTKERIERVKIKSGLKWEKRPFGSRNILANFYKKKTEGKKQGLSYGEIYVTKVCLNGIYGIPALRATFNIFEWNGRDYQNNENGFKNRERNVAFASAVTAYALRNLLLPLTHNVKGVDTGFIYADTDSIFCTKKYFDTIKDKVKFDKYELGAWDIEHEGIKAMSVLNHKKYCLLNKDDEIEVRCGGVPLDTFNTNMSFEEFVKTQFSDGVQLPVKKHAYTKTGTIAIFTALTELKQGGKYLKPEGKESRLYYNLCMIKGYEKYKEEEERLSPIYIEAPFMSCGLGDLKPVKRPTDGMKLRALRIKYKMLQEEVESK